MAYSLISVPQTIEVDVDPISLIDDRLCYVQD